MIRLFDIVFSFLGLLFLLPLFLVLYVVICIESRGDGFYCQT
ncbi:MAG TPA: sugar transferase, partial [Paludibacteraceae bacterium]|nr:sugar transferase [Paludibacteraceae bacterium]